ncbi:MULTISPECIES: cation:proton antiporter [unclassified Haladaptatus]|uniref:cation:proton antiporter n=1 Tax=unclassified Haladaptatus TaxID=2622732 RepID=UPI00209BF9B7|nr:MULTISPECIES: cation:proton antiporter [unclassified Haladaptatus]MCO8243528.1 cation:proton antiporter [Haladaptatus sp. AB643]MCO8254937.1 cation:proton antiporter [Haladaptatus sp. AB618]
MSLSFHFVLVLALVYGTSLVFKSLTEYNVPILAVEMLAGILFGSIFDIVNPSMPGFEFFTALAAFGLLMIMFDAGLELDPDTIRRNPRQIAELAVFTFLLPFISGFALARVLGLNLFASFLTGVTISTTSLGLIYPLVEDFSLLQTDTGQTILSVAVMNDLLSVAALAYGITLITAPKPVIGVILVTIALFVFFIGLPFLLEDYLSNTLQEGMFENPVKVGVFLMVTLAYCMELIGIHAILGAFFAGLLVAVITHEGHSIQNSMKPVSDLVTPVFFFYVGLNFDLESFSSASPLLLAGILVLGIGSKVVGSVVGGWFVGLEQETVALLASSMPGRLSISVAAAEIGLTRGIISEGLYNAFLILSVVSVFLAILSFRYFVLRDSEMELPRQVL